MAPQTGAPVVWSPTDIVQAQRCGLAYSLKQTRTLGTKQLAPSPPANELGKALHRVAEFFIKQTGKTTLVVEDEWEIPPVYFDNLKRFLCQELPALERLVGAAPKRYAELSLRVDDKLRPVYGYPNGFITGKLDLGVYDAESKSLLIVDYKTGQIERESLVSFYRPQLELYSLLFHRCQSPVERVGLLLYAGYSGESFWLSDGFEPYDDKAAIAHLGDALRKAIEGSKTSEPRPHPYCKYCDFRQICPAYKEGG